MGQISLPVLNRTGYSMFWQSVWDSKLNYTRNWKEDYLIRKIVSFVFIKRWTKNWRFYTSKILKNSIILENKNVFNYFSDPITLHKTVAEENREKKEHLKYVLRVWIVKFQKYIIIYFFLYTPKQFSFYIKKDTQPLKKNFQLINFLYYRLLNRLNKNYFKQTKLNRTQF